MNWYFPGWHIRHLVYKIFAGADCWYMCPAIYSNICISEMSSPWGLIIVPMYTVALLCTVPQLVTLTPTSHCASASCEYHKTGPLIQGGMQNIIVNRRYAKVYARALCFKCNLWMEHRTVFSETTCLRSLQSLRICRGHTLLFRNWRQSRWDHSCWQVAC